MSVDVVNPSSGVNSGSSSVQAGDDDTAMKTDCVAEKYNHIALVAEHATAHHDMRTGVNATATKEDIPRHIYEMCLDGYGVLLAGELETEEVRTRLDNEYVRLRLWGIDTGISEGKLTVLLAHPLYKTAGSILLKVLRRLVKLNLAYFKFGADAKTAWLKRTSEYNLEAPPFLQTARPREAVSATPINKDDDALSLEQKVQKLHDAFWAEKGEQSGIRKPVAATVTMEDEHESSPRRHVVPDWDDDGYENPSIDPSDSASQAGTHSKLAESTSRPGSESRSADQSSSTVLSSGAGSTTSSASSIVVLKAIDALAALNNCLFSIIRELDMAMANYGEGSLSQLFAAVKSQAGQPLSNAEKQITNTAEKDKAPEEETSKTYMSGTKSMESPASLEGSRTSSGPESIVWFSERLAREQARALRTDSNKPKKDEETVPLGTRLPPTAEAVKKVEFSPWVEEVPGAFYSLPSLSQWQPLYIPIPPIPAPAATPKQRQNPPLPSPENNHKPRAGPPRTPDVEASPPTQKSSLHKPSAETIKYDPPKTSRTQTSHLVPPTQPSPNDNNPSQTKDSEPQQNREEIVAAAMTNDKTLFGLMQSYAGRIELLFILRFY